MIRPTRILPLSPSPSSAASTSSMASSSSETCQEIIWRHHTPVLPSTGRRLHPPLIVTYWKWSIFYFQIGLPKDNRELWWRNSNSTSLFWNPWERRDPENGEGLHWCPEPHNCRIASRGEKSGNQVNTPLRGINSANIGWFMVGLLCHRWCFKSPS